MLPVNFACAVSFYYVYYVYNIHRKCPKCEGGQSKNFFERTVSDSNTSQIHQNPCSLASVQHLEVSQSFQIPLCDGNVGVSHQARQAVQVQSVLQLHLREGVAAGVRTDANISAHAYGLASYLDNTVYRFCSHRSAVAAEEHIFGYAAMRKEVLSRAEVLEHPFVQQGTFRNNTLFISLAMNEDILILDL